MSAAKITIAPGAMAVLVFAAVVLLQVATPLDFGFIGVLAVTIAILALLAAGGFVIYIAIRAVEGGS